MSISLPVKINDSLASATVADGGDLTAIVLTEYNWIEFTVVFTGATSSSADAWFKVSFDGTPPHATVTTTGVDTLLFFVDEAAADEVYTYGPYLLANTYTDFDAHNETGSVIQFSINAGMVSHDYRSAIP